MTRPEQENDRRTSTPVGTTLFPRGTRNVAVAISMSAPNGAKLRRI